MSYPSSPLVGTPRAPLPIPHPLAHRGAQVLQDLHIPATSPCGPLGTPPAPTLSSLMYLQPPASSWQELVRYS